MPTNVLALTSESSQGQQISPLIQFQPSGPWEAKVMIVGEAPGEEEVRLKTPFVGASGYLLEKVLKECGYTRDQCFVTNVIRERPPQNDADAFFAAKVKERTPAHIQINNR